MVICESKDEYEAMKNIFGSFDRLEMHANEHPDCTNEDVVSMIREMREAFSKIKFDRH